MAVETKIALAICQEVDTPRSLAMAILLSVALGRSKLNFGLKADEEQKERAWVEILKMNFDPYAEPTIASHDGVRSLNSGKCLPPHGISKQLWRYVDNIDVVKRNYQATVFLQKWKGLSLKTVDPVVAARKGFYQSEAECCNTNARFAAIIAQIDGPDGITVIESAVEEHLLKCRKIFRKLMGDLPRLEQLSLRFGPGSVYEKSEAYGVNGLTVADKLDATPYVTTGGLELFYELWKETTWFKEWYPRSVALNLPLYKTCRAERFFTVHKKATIARACALGPGANIMLQLAIAGPMRASLNREGLLLVPKVDYSNDYYQMGKFQNDRTRKVQIWSERRHHEKARMGSITGEDATVDFSRASDTVAREVVRFLASKSWFSLLDSARTKFIEVDFDKDGVTLPSMRTIWLEKFSSMGNGFTFELETAIFYTLARSVCDDHEDVTVYGDDVILPTHRARAFLALARFFGFTPNVDKTYVSGCFRESCGGDFLHGQNIRPYFQKEEINEPRHTISLVNGLYRASAGAASRSRGYLNTAWKRALEQIPLEYRQLRGPEHLGDAVIHCHDFDDYALAPRGWTRDRFIRSHGKTYVISERPRTFIPFRAGNSNRFFKGIKVTAARRPLERYDPPVQFLVALYGGSSDGIAPRGALLSTGFTYYEAG